ncbi:MAG: hypothetical protein ACJ74U_01240 [Jatrophihabitantaceae bacterium]
MDSERGAGLLHRLTSADAEHGWQHRAADPRLRLDLVLNDPATMPPQVKAYGADLPVVRLPRELPRISASATEVLAGRPLPRQPLDARQLGRVLFLGAGVVRTSRRDGVSVLFRAAGSAGGRFPLEVYASTRDVAGVPDGVHWYDPVNHALVRIGPPAEGAVTTVVITGVPWRTGWRYAERGWRHLYWDAGTLSSQLLAAADGAGLRPRLRTLFPDAAVGRLVGAGGVHEYPLALLTLGDGAPAVWATGPAVTGYLPPVELPLCTEAQWAGDAAELGQPWPTGPALDDVPAAPPLDEVILRRGSQRRMDRAARLPRPVLDWPMRAALRGIEVPHWVVVHAVEQLPAGIYRWPRLDNPIRVGELRDELARVCMDQALAAEAGYVVIAAIENAHLDDRGYRDAQLAAGLAEGRLHLASYALGATATGMTFYDAAVPALLAEPADLITLLFTCVGVGEYASKAGGGPGAPVEVRQVTPRFTDE